MMNMREAEITGIARTYMGNTAYPTAVFAFAVAAAFAFTVYAAVTELWSLWLAFPIASYLAFMSYTPLHESVHRNICGRHKSRLWLNDLTGYTMASLLGFSFNVHKWAHREHHLHTNKPGRDPDHIFTGNALYDGLLGGVLLVGNEYRLFFKHGFVRLSRARQAIVLAEIGFFIGWRLLLGLWFPVETVVLCLLANVAGVTWLVIIFAWIVHIPFDETERYKDTSVYLLPKPVHRLATWLWLWQNYHAIHHLYPRIPFYKYDDVYERIEPGMAERQTPIRRLLSA